MIFRISHFHRIFRKSEAENTPGANACAGNFTRLNCPVSCQGSQGVAGADQPTWGNQWTRKGLPGYRGIIRKGHQTNFIQFSELSEMWNLSRYYQIYYKLYIVSFFVSFGYVFVFFPYIWTRFSVPVEMDHGYPSLHRDLDLSGAEMSSMLVIRMQ